MFIQWVSTHWIKPIAKETQSRLTSIQWALAHCHTENEQRTTSVTRG